MAVKVGDYNYSGVVVDGRMFAIIRNGDELQRIREVFDDRPGVLIWDYSKPMTVDVLGILKHETQQKDI